MKALAIVLLCFFCASEAGNTIKNYPLILLCTSNSSFPIANCQFRSGVDQGFTTCGKYANTTVTIIEDTQEYCKLFVFTSLIHFLDEQCTVYNIDGEVYGLDPYSIVTLTTYEGIRH
jgi:hypothetical protein